MMPPVGQIDADRQRPGRDVLDVHDLETQLVRQRVFDN
jgi:hypothetical protein